MLFCMHSYLWKPSYNHTQFPVVWERVYELIWNVRGVFQFPEHLTNHLDMSEDFSSGGLGTLKGSWHLFHVKDMIMLKGFLS